MLLTQKAKDELLVAAAAGAIEAIEGAKAEWLKEADARQQLAVAELEEKLAANIQTLFEQALEADRKKRYDSVEPFVEIISQTFSEEGGVQLRLDWNKPFIDYLKKNGFTGPSDEAIVDNWIVSLSRERIAEGGSEFK